MNSIGDISFISVANDDVTNRIKLNEHSIKPWLGFDNPDTKITITGLNIKTNKSTQFRLNWTNVITVNSSKSFSKYPVYSITCLTEGSKVEIEYEYGNYTGDSKAVASEGNFEGIKKELGDLKTEHEDLVEKVEKINTNCAAPDLEWENH